MFSFNSHVVRGGQLFSLVFRCRINGRSQDTVHKHYTISDSGLCVPCCSLHRPAGASKPKKSAPKAKSKKPLALDPPAAADMPGVAAPVSYL